MTESRMWLIRFSDQSFSRPIPESALIEKIQKGELSRQDEICFSTGYWFSVGDVVEIRKFLGNIRLDSLVSRLDEGETTTHETTTHTDVTGLQRPAVNPVSEKKSLSGEFGEEGPKKGNPIFFALVMIIFLYTLFLIWKNTG